MRIDSLRAKLAQLTDTCLPTTPLVGLSEQVGSTGTGGPEDVTEKVCVARAKLDPPAASNLWPPAVASAGTVKVSVTVPFADDVADPTEIEAVALVNHLNEVASPAPNPVPLTDTDEPGSPVAGVRESAAAMETYRLREP